MLKEIIIVDSISKAIKNVGIEQLDGLILQEMGGQYFFIDVDKDCTHVKEYAEELAKCVDCEEAYCILKADEGCPQGWLKTPKIQCYYECHKCVHPLPLKIAYFIMQAMRMQKSAFDLTIPPSQEGVEESLGHYLRIPKESQEDQDEANM